MNEEYVATRTQKGLFHIGLYVLNECVKQILEEDVINLMLYTCTPEERWIQLILCLPRLCVMAKLLRCTPVDSLGNMCCDLLRVKANCI